MNGDWLKIDGYAHQLRRALRRADAGVSVTITSGASSAVNVVRARAPASVAPAA